jgi:hypothetical protein
VKRIVKIAIVAIVTLLLWNMPAEWYGINNLTVIQQRVIAIFVFATLMWILEIVSSWATSVALSPPSLASSLSLAIILALLIAAGKTALPTSG